MGSEISHIVSSERGCSVDVCAEMTLPLAAAASVSSDTIKVDRLTYGPKKPNRDCLIARLSCAQSVVARVSSLGVHISLLAMPNASELRQNSFIHLQSHFPPMTSYSCLAKLNTQPFLRQKQSPSLEFTCKL